MAFPVNNVKLRANGAGWTRFSFVLFSTAGFIFFLNSVGDRTFFWAGTGKKAFNSNVKYPVTSFCGDVRNTLFMLFSAVIQGYHFKMLHSVGVELWLCG